MWYRTSGKRFGRAILGPAAAAVIVVIILAITGITNWIALLGFWIVTFSLTLTLLEFWRGMQARVRSKGENPLVALAALIPRNRRRYGGYIIHVGVLVMAFGIISTELYQQETQIRLTRGQSASLADYSMTFNGIERYPGADDLINTEATLDVYRNGEFITTLHPRTELYTRTQQPMTIPDARSTVAEDFYVILVNWEGTSDDAATFRLFLNPLINWVWAGALVFVAGTLVAAWPDPAEEKLARAAAARRRIATVSGD
jgi:cytochrome c-type biogenesis protein CcmF